MWGTLSIATTSPPKKNKQGQGFIPWSTTLPQTTMHDIATGSATFSVFNPALRPLCHRQDQCCRRFHSRPHCRFGHVFGRKPQNGLERNGHCRHSPKFGFESKGLRVLVEMYFSMSFQGMDCTVYILYDCIPYTHILGGALRKSGGRTHYHQPLQDDVY